MPGKVIQLLVKAGDKVKRGAPLAILEAMKMENTLAAQADATVAEIAVGIGDQVGEGALILTFETEARK
jgi:3-methylcrotonyl-CoA carboxylase alpha subunit